jgi:hypothetical protein
LSELKIFPLAPAWENEKKKKQNGGRLGRGDCGVPAGLQLLVRGSAVHAGLAKLRNKHQIKLGNTYIAQKTVLNAWTKYL